MLSFRLLALASLLLTTGCVSSSPLTGKVASPGVALSMDFVWMEFDPADLIGHPSFRRELRVTDEAVQAAVAAGKGDAVWLQKVVTTSGLPTVVEAVQEHIYPTEFDVSENDIEVQGGGGEKDRGTTTTPTIIPGAFETRKIGFILNVTPELKPDGRVYTRLLLEFAGLAEWNDFGSSITLPDGSVQKAEMRQPIFNSRNSLSFLQLVPGTPTIAGAGNNPESGKMSVLIVTARP
jgi:hypothetical protein